MINKLTHVPYIMLIKLINKNFPEQRILPYGCEEHDKLYALGEQDEM